jgi:hypothetical protein
VDLNGPFCVDLATFLLRVYSALLLGVSSVIARPEGHLAELLLLSHALSPHPICLVFFCKEAMQKTCGSALCAFSFFFFLSGIGVAARALASV